MTDAVPEIKYGVPTPAEIGGKTGRDGKVLAHGTSTLMVLGGAR